MIHSASSNLTQRLASITERMIAISTGAGLPAAELVAVSKIQPDDRIVAALDAGQRVFGENRVQEAQTRWADRRAQFGDLKLHLIGPLQTNKVDAALNLFDVIETLDRPKLARALAKGQTKTGRKPHVLIQVNTGEESQKAGVLPTDLASLVEEARALDLDVCGLMCIPPVEEPAGAHFALLAKLARAHGLKRLSMGMSGDFETAIKFGATHIRVGSALFGDRVASAGG
ncbi:MAG: YggS family pyridoxal phosphate-dependent enzyme [Hyphomonadaceae bacterium]